MLADARPVRESGFTVEGMEVAFTVEGKPARLKEKPYLLGPQPGKALLDHDIAYAFRARQYNPSPALVRQLRQATQPIKVRVFFGNWCPHCQQMVPRVLRVAAALAGSPIRFEFYGLPSPFGEEPEAKRMGINGVPTGIVYRGTKESAASAAASGAFPSWPSSASSTTARRRPAGSFPSVPRPRSDGRRIHRTVPVACLPSAATKAGRSRTIAQSFSSSTGIPPRRRRSPRCPPSAAACSADTGP